jgi:hypothetical protein
MDELLEQLMGKFEQEREAAVANADQVPQLPPAISSGNSPGEIQIEERESSLEFPQQDDTQGTGFDSDESLSLPDDNAVDGGGESDDTLNVSLLGQEQVEGEELQVRGDGGELPSSGLDSSFEMVNGASEHFDSVELPEQTPDNNSTESDTPLEVPAQAILPEQNDNLMIPDTSGMVDSASEATNSEQLAPPEEFQKVEDFGEIPDSSAVSEAPESDPFLFEKQSFLPENVDDQPNMRDDATANVQQLEFAAGEHVPEADFLSVPKVSTGDGGLFDDQRVMELLGEEASREIDDRTQSVRTDLMNFMSDRLATFQSQMMHDILDVVGMAQLEQERRFQL